VARIGAEQGFCLIGDDMSPAVSGPEILVDLADPQFTTELARWNLELNLDPQSVGAGCIRRMHAQLTSLLAKAQQAASARDCRVVLTGILPTIRQSDLEFRNMTPNPRYRLLDTILKEMRGENFLLHIEGVDEVNLRHDSILFEACNTSFQVHLQVDPADFVDRYNWAQVIAGPVLACAVNSPILLGRELWSETRIALFRQSLDVRHAGTYLSERQPRVAFGRDWLRESAAQIFRQDVAMYPPIIAADIADESALEQLDQGRIPKLRAMNLHNGTLYKWNRACYGVGNDRPHLRIENRYLPAGPTIIDEMSNAVFWIGLMLAMPDQCRGAWADHFWFQDVRANFLRAARNGLANEMVWFDEYRDAAELIENTLLPMAAQGLGGADIPAEEYEPYLRIVQERVASRQTGANWTIHSLRVLRQSCTVDDSLLLLTDAMARQSMADLPVHRWEIPNRSALPRIPGRNRRVESIMMTNVVTVRDDDLLDLAVTLMEWNGFHHLPVENSAGKVIGVISTTDIARFRRSGQDQPDALVRDWMTGDIVTVSPETSLQRAEKLMAVNEFGSLPVVRDGRVVGIVTVKDLQRIAQAAAAE
jgi:CBS domain-containing protein